MKNSIKEFLPLIFLDVISIISIIQIISSEYVLDDKHYIGLILLFICSFLFFVNRKFYMYLFFLTLIIGVFGIIKFSATTYMFGVGIIKIQLIPFIAIIIYLYVYKLKIIALLNKLKTEKDTQNDFDISKDRFKQKFKNLSDDEIELKLKEKLVTEAKQALVELMSER